MKKKDKPEWDLGRKVVNTRQALVKKMREENDERQKAGENSRMTIDVMYWVGIIDLDFFKKDPRLHFRSKNGQLVLDDQPYDLSCLDVAVANLWLKDAQWLHLLVEETVWVDGKHRVKIVSPYQDRLNGYQSHSSQLDEAGWTAIHKIYKIGIGNHQKTVILENGPFVDAEAELQERETAA